MNAKMDPMSWWEISGNKIKYPKIAPTGSINPDKNEKAKAFFEEAGEEVLITKSNEIAIPTLDSEGNEAYMVITFKVPTGSRDGEAYDGHAEAKDYERAVAEKAENAPRFLGEVEKVVIDELLQGAEDELCLAFFNR